MTSASDPNVSPVTEANISPTTGAHLTPSERPQSRPPARSPAPPYARSSAEPRANAQLLSPAWAVGIALGTVALAYLGVRTASSVAPALVAKATKAPAPSEDKRSAARWKAQQLTSAGDWLFAALDHHRDIEGAFGAVSSAMPGVRATALKALATVLMGHSIAEEAVLYPALAEAGETARSSLAYGEQAMVKTQMAALQDIDPESDAFLTTLQEIRSAVLLHMYEEERTWFPLLKQRLSEMDQRALTTRFLDEYRRYTNAA
jgi:hemerythrin superfamily protein